MLIVHKVGCTLGIIPATGGGIPRGDEWGVDLVNVFKYIFI